MTDKKKANQKASPNNSQTDINTIVDLMSGLYTCIRRAMFITTETRGQTMSLIKFCDSFERFGRDGDNLSEREFGAALMSLAVMSDAIFTDLRHKRISIMGINL